jgi:hypothetical protein
VGWHLISRVIVKAKRYIVVKDVLVHLVIYTGQCGIELGHGIWLDILTTFDAAISKVIA